MLGKPAPCFDLDSLDRAVAQPGREAPELLGERDEGRERLHRLRADGRDVDRVGDDPAGQRGPHLLRGDHAGAVLRLRRGRPEVRGDDDVVAPEQGVLGHRLGWEHVERRAGHLAGLERRLEGLEVDQLAAGAVDDPDAVLHRGEGLRAQPVDRLRGLRQVDRDQVGAGVELLAGVDALDGELAEALGGDELVEGDHVHVEGLRPTGHELTDPAEADHSEGLAVELVAAEAGARPLARGEGRMRLRDVSEQRQRQRQRVLGGGDGVGLGGVRDHDPSLGRRRDVDVVDARSRTADRLHPIGALDQLGGHLRRRADHDRVELGDPGLELAVGPVDADLDVEALAQQLDPGVGDLLLDQDPRALAHERIPSAFSSSQSIDAVRAWTSAVSIAGNIPTRSWLRPSLR